MTQGAILIVDDNVVNTKLVAFLLAAHGYDVRTASDAEEALGILASFRPGLILTDLQLPGMDGLELTRRLRRDAATRDIVIVAVTAFAMKGDEAIAFEAGCDGYITKPIDTRTLPSRVAAFLSSGGRSRQR